MRVRSRDLIFVVIVVVVVGGLYYLSTKGKARAVPANPQHQTAKTRTDCLVCHTPDKFSALELAHRHPGKWRDERVSCFHCHAPLKQTARNAIGKREAVAALESK